MKFIRIYLFVLIIIGIILLFTQNFWVPKLVNKILSFEVTPPIPAEIPFSGHIKYANNDFNFNYSQLFQIKEGNTSPTLEWKLNARHRGMLLVTLLVPNTFIPNTNFSDANLTVGKSSEPNEVKNCLLAINDEVESGPTAISGYPFAKYISNGARAGNFYETTSYRGMVRGDCYAIEYMFHSTNIGNYSPEMEIIEFDKSKIFNEFEKTIGSFKFFVNNISN